MTKKLLLFCFILTLFFCAQSNAQNEPDSHAETTIEDMVITSERFPVLEKKSPQFIQSFSVRELKRTGANNVIDALRRIGGFSYKAYAPLGIKAGMESHVSIRGVENGELILINGMPIQNTGNQNYQLYNLPIESIDRIEVIKGASSTQYGADAMSGVINIITKKNPCEKEGSASVEFGDYRYHNHNIGYYGPGLNLGFNYQHLKPMEKIQIDYADNEYNNSQEMNRYAINMNARIADNLYFDFLASSVDSGYEVYDLSNSQIKESDDQMQYEAFTDLRYQTEDTRIKAFFKYGDEDSKEYEYDPQKVLDAFDENRHFNTGISIDYKFDFLTAEFKTGFEHIHRAADFESGYGSHYRNDYAVFAIITRQFFKRLKVNLGMREQLIKADSEGEDHDKFTPSLGLNYKVNKSLNLFANVAEAFRAPSFNNLYYDSWLIQGNPGLSPEKGWTYDAGVKFTNLWSKIRLSGFYMDYEDKIESYNPGGGYPYIYFNAGNYESVGMDWDIDLYPFHRQKNWTRHVSFYSSGTWCDPTAEEPDGTEYQTGPKLSSSFGVEYNTEPFIFSVNTKYVTSRPEELDNISTVDISGKYRLYKGFLTLAVDNVFDQDVEINGNKETDNYIYYGMPRFFKIGYEIQF